MLLIVDRFNISQKYVIVLVQRITKWKASYFTLLASYYPVSQTSMPLSATKFMASLPAESISKDAEIAMKALEKSRVRIQDDIGFDFASHCLKNWRESL